MKIALLKPSQITITTPRAQTSAYKLWANNIDRLVKKEVNNNYIENFKKVNNSWSLSKATKKKISESINNMMMLSKARNIETIKGKKIYNFKLAFITLTLPAAQIHSDKVIKKECLNQFLTELRQQYGVKNYVWKAELQKNKSIHFHLVIDTYVDYFIIRRVWNRIINKLDYVDRYKRKFEKLKFSEYCDLYKAGNNFNRNDLFDRYIKGVKSKWSNPNSVDVKSISNRNNIIAYIQKYIVKSVDKNNDDLQDTERILQFGRVWSRSESLSRLKYKNWFDLRDLQEFINDIKNKCSKYKEVVEDYYSVIYFNAAELSKSSKDFLNRYLINNAIMYKYKFPVSYE